MQVFYFILFYLYGGPNREVTTYFIIWKYVY